MEKRQKLYCPLLLAAAHIAKSNGGITEETYQCLEDRCAWWKINADYGRACSRSDAPRGWCAVRNTGRE
jgi:hypothetical protein